MDSRITLLRNVGYLFGSLVSPYKSKAIYILAGRESDAGGENTGADYDGGNRATSNSQAEISGGKMHRGGTRSSWQRLASQAECLGVPCK